MSLGLGSAGSPNVNLTIGSVIIEFLNPLVPTVLASPSETHSPSDSSLSSICAFCLPLIDLDFFEVLVAISISIWVAVVLTLGLGLLFALGQGLYPGLLFCLRIGLDPLLAVLLGAGNEMWPTFRWMDDIPFAIDDGGEVLDNTVKILEWLGGLRA